jgi:hypothetical protein
MTAGSTALRPAARAATVYRMELKDLTPTPGALAEAREIVNVSGTHDGYCVLLGLSHDGLVEALLQQTQMQVVVVDADRTKVLPLRARLIAAGAYGRRAEAFCASPDRFDLPPYLCSLLVVDSNRMASASDVQRTAWCQSVHPYGGMLGMVGTSATFDALRKSVNLAFQGRAKLESRAGGLWMRRDGPLPNTAAWTHECSDAGRSYYSDDALVAPPLAVLWYGDRPGYGFWKEKDYGTGVKPQVVGGRVFALRVATATLAAYDVYSSTCTRWRSATAACSASIPVPGSTMTGTGDAVPNRRRPNRRSWLSTHAAARSSGRPCAAIAIAHSPRNNG